MGWGGYSWLGAEGQGDLAPRFILGVPASNPRCRAWPGATLALLYPQSRRFQPHCSPSQSPSLQLEAFPAAVSLEAGVTNRRHCPPEAGGKEVDAVQAPTGVPTSLPTHTQYDLPAERLSRGSLLLKFTSCR